jgi:hypothetical protein
MLSKYALLLLNGGITFETLHAQILADRGTKYDATNVALQDLERELSALACTAGRCAKYLMLRGAAGCGDHGHEAAAKAAEKISKPLRKALGYSYP